MMSRNTSSSAPSGHSAARLYRIAGVAQLLEAHAFHHPAPIDVRHGITRLQHADPFFDRESALVDRPVPAIAFEAAGRRHRGRRGGGSYRCDASHRAITGTATAPSTFASYEVRAAEHAVG